MIMGKYIFTPSKKMWNFTKNFCIFKKYEIEGF